MHCIITVKNSIMLFTCNNAIYVCVKPNKNINNYNACCMYKNLSGVVPIVKLAMIIKSDRGTNKKNINKNI